MRLSLKNSLYLLGWYAAVLLVLAAIAVFQLLMLEANVQKETARLFAREVAGALTEPSLDRLLQADREARVNLKTLIEQLTKHSQVVTAISVVDSNGRVVASDEPNAASRRPTPEQFFGSSQRMRFITFGAFPFSSGSYELAVPLVQRGARVGYLQIRLQSQSVAEMNRQLWDRLFLAAILGLFCIVALGFMLHLELSRRGKTLALTLEAALRGETPAITPELDEFSQAIETAERAGIEIHRARTERGRLLTLSQVLNVGVMLVDGGDRIAFASRRARELFRSSSDEELAAAFARVQPELERELRDPQRPDRDGVRVDVETENGDGGRRLRLEAYPLESEEDGGARVVLVRDRTTMKALEMDLRLASQLKSLSRLYLSVVHDIRAPLAAIAAHIELLSSSYAGPDATSEQASAKRREYLAVVSQELPRLKRSLDSLLNHATLPRDELEEMDLRELLQELEHLLRPQCGRQRVALTMRVPETPVRVLGSRDALKQALVNVGINALEAMPQGGKLEMSLEGVDSKASIAIADSGPGIPADLMERIFSMHFSTKQEGTGIGLYVARAVVESNGGEIRVSSEAGRGATFQIDLPALSAGG